MPQGRWGDKGPADTDDFTLDFSAELGSATIADATWTADGLTVESDSHADRTATARLSGGEAGTDYVVTATVTTSDGRTLQRSASLLVTEL